MSHSQPDPFYALHSDRCSLVVECTANTPGILYWGPRLGDTTTHDMLALLATRQEAQASVEADVIIALSPEAGAGFPGNAGIRVHRDGRQWGVYSTLKQVVRESGNTLQFVSECEAVGLAITHRLALDPASNVLRATTAIANTGTAAASVEFCAAPTIPIADHYTQILGFEGRWANEFQRHRCERQLGSYLRENRDGRTSHHSFPGLVIHPAATTEQAGAAIGLHLGWSGNFNLRVDTLPDGRGYAQFGEWFFPGELRLAPGDAYESPPLYGVHTQQGFSSMSRCFHQYVRSTLTDGRVAGRPKPVHFNSWEAVYFDTSTESLRELVDLAADIGVERFVLDDGWFRNRNDDTAGLGDWFVDDSKFPRGLTPLAALINERGMEFGLWIEPEMVNPDSDLYRDHPDWALNADPAPRLLSRKQLVLDLTRDDVADYLFERMDALLSEYPITYLKWDMNRNLEQPGGSDGRAVAHAQTLAFYRLLARVRDAHGSVEIESCSSGGGRADFGVLEHTDRIWTSDSNDALDRLRIQAGFSYFFPSEVMGAHVGPRECHITGRTLSIELRAGVALFGDMGIEADLREMGTDERAVLADAVALHKVHRELIFSGDLVRLECGRHEQAFGIVAADRREALFSYAVVATPPRSAPGRYRFAGLEPDIAYELGFTWPRRPGSYSPSVLEAAAGKRFSGAALQNAGLQLPILQPESLLVMHLRAVT